MAEMAAAAAAMDLGPYHAMAGVGLRFNRTRNGIVKAWPARPALELALGREQRLTAGGAVEGSRPLLVQERATAGRFRSMFAHDRILLGRQDPAPFGLAAGYRIGLWHRQHTPRFFHSSAGRERCAGGLASRFDRRPHASG